jgi:hypothetical protein
MFLYSLAVVIPSLPCAASNELPAQSLVAASSVTLQLAARDSALAFPQLGDVSSRPFNVGREDAQRRSRSSGEQSASCSGTGPTLHV